ncbi:MAG TPA: hypothetical protein VHH55_00575 [Gaiellaceae bacterium]|jgi:hypothetical protein|nr:hypothetical protein [Gaiellaceae bacterium]
MRSPYSHPATFESERDEPRIAGIDRRTIAPSLLVLGLAVLMSVILPQINDETEYSEATEKGDIVQLADGISLVPAPGWNLADGALAGETLSTVGSTASTDLVHGDVAFNVQAAPFEGTASALLTRIDEINEDLQSARGRTAQTTGRYAVTTRQGVDGLARDFVGSTRSGSVIAFVFRPPGQATEGQPAREGVEVVVYGPSSALSRRRDDIVSMIRSIRTGS